MSEKHRANYFHILYYCYYRWSQRINGEHFPHRYAACTMVSIFMVLVSTIFIVSISWVFHINVIEGLSRSGAGLAVVLLIFLVYLYFSYKKRGDNVIEIYRSTIPSKLVTKIVLLTWIGSLCILCLLLFSTMPVV